jgi:acetylcholinesterase
VEIRILGHSVGISFYVTSIVGSNSAVVNTRLKGVPILGSFHASDILNVYGDGDMTDYLINFVNNLDPNADETGIEWPKYTVEEPNLLVFQDGLTPLETALDDYRVEPIEFLVGLTLENPI